MRWARQLRVRLEHRFLVLEPQDAVVEVEQRAEGAVDAHSLPRLDAMIQQEPAAVRSDRLAAAAHLHAGRGALPHTDTGLVEVASF